MDESNFATEVMIPSFMKAAEKIRVATIEELRNKGSGETSGGEGVYEPVLVSEPEPSVDLYGAPGVLLFFAGGTIQISAAPIQEEEDLFLYRVVENGYEDWVFVAAMLPEDMEYFPLLPLMYDRMRFGGKERSDMARLYEDTRLPALQEILVDLSMMTVVSESDGRRVALAIEEGEPIRFYYDHTIPELELTILTVEFDGKTCRIPEFGGISDAGYYSRVLSALSGI